MTVIDGYPVKQDVYHLSICTDWQNWDSLVANSMQGHIFSSSQYLKALGLPFTCYQVLTPTGVCVAGIAVIEDGKAMHSAPITFTPHQGIFFARPIDQLKNHKKLATQFRITEFIIEQLISIYQSCSMSLSPFFCDLRPFLWHNYGLIDQPKFGIVNRYTSRLSLNNFNFQDYLLSIRSVRRQEYKKSQAVVESSNNIAQFLSMYKKTFERQGLEVNSQDIALVDRITKSSLQNKYGRLVSAQIDRQPASMALFLFDNNCAYYLFGANDPKFRNSGTSTKLMLESIQYFSEQNLESFDFVGVNSPSRGDYKLSFNSDLLLYHEVHLLSAQ